ncbi:phosphoglycerate dehydrogenase [Fluviispira multicolorata]|uniref:D-3-phosphoglycerate dehydrogenase n=1 Tax=Fluviispira multicolorata TaxID=2654512 RepID=A0A833JGT1_9BACT|nr:phosphoglycerate dehydrogenase [Fluviispira multicolorata]KAB8032206.1 phosphoglycerate dehydrogenase [Fluviispira multicolorata]
MEKAVKILITGKLHEIALKLLNQQPPELTVSESLNIVYLPDAPRDVILKEIEDTNVLISRSETDVDAELLRKAKKLSVVARAAVGYGNIDCDLATEMGILVVNTPGKNTNSAAELTFGLLLALVRKIPQAHLSTSAGGWNRHKFSGTELGGKTIGLVGLGNVGHRVARFAKGFDMRVIAYDPYISEDVFRKNHAERKNTLEELLAECDILSVHVPLNKETKGMVSTVELKKMRKGGIVLNAARGGIVSEKALLEVLNEGYVVGAAVDTFDNEPKPLQELIKHPNVIVTPHIGASTAEAQYRIGETIAIQVLKALRGEIVDYPVNLPHVSLLGTNDLRVFSVLSEKVSRFGAQIFDFQPALLKLSIKANINKEDLQVLKLSSIKGFLSHASDEFVSYVNAERLLTRKGLKFEIDIMPSTSTKNELLFEVFGNGTNEKISVGAVIYDGKYVRLSSINDFLFEIELDSDLIVMQNHDRPGVIGDVGSYLAKNNVNIAQFELSRNRRGGMAMSLIRIDGELESEVIAGLRKLPNLISARLVSGL